ncbi:hypothetical protein ACNSTQ_06300 [Alkalihalobacterium sp. APHAB7]
MNLSIRADLYSKNGPIATKFTKTTFLKVCCFFAFRPQANRMLGSSAQREGKTVQKQQSIR